MEKFVIWIVCLLAALFITTSLDLSSGAAFFNGVLFGVIAAVICEIMD